MSLLEKLVDTDIPRGVLLADAGYGSDSLFRYQLSALGLCKADGVQSTTKVSALDSISSNSRSNLYKHPILDHHTHRVPIVQLERQVIFYLPSPSLNTDFIHDRISHPDESKWKSSGYSSMFPSYFKLTSTQPAKLRILLRNNSSGMPPSLPTRTQPGSGSCQKRGQRIIPSDSNAAL
jgi:hypothetical protein